MPIVQINLMSGRTVEQKRSLVKEVIDAVCRTLDRTPDQVRIILHDLKEEDYAVGGVLKLDNKKK